MSFFLFDNYSLVRRTHTTTIRSTHRLCGKYAELNEQFYLRQLCRNFNSKQRAEGALSFIVPVRSIATVQHGSNSVDWRRLHRELLWPTISIVEKYKFSSIHSPLTLATYIEPLINVVIFIN